MVCKLTSSGLNLCNCLNTEDSSQSKNTKIDNRSILINKNVDLIDYSTRYSRYGWGIDVRATYSHLPCQPFWTWLTGKYPKQLEPRRPIETILAPWQLILQLTWSWALILISLLIGAFVYKNSDIGLLIKIICSLFLFVIVTNRTRGLLHTFHYTNHGASIKNLRLAKFLGKWFMSIPIMHLTWDEYHKIHAGDHHATTYLCTDADPDQKFMKDHGFYSGMPEYLFWRYLVFAPFHPKAIWEHIYFRFLHNFIIPNRSEIISRFAFWTSLLTIVTLTNTIDIFVIYYLIPLFLITQYSSWLQHITEHLWFAVRPNDVPLFVFMSSLTWGRFLGRPYPKGTNGIKGIAYKIQWWAKILIIDIPIKLFSFMQDLPSHDYHHRSPRINFWSISRERAAMEGRPSKYGPMTETWGLLESLLIVRDQVCYGKGDAFGVWEWARNQEKRRNN
ncbi:hypothetical protein [Entomobacter blattae]|uniref:Fatty acid desaturase domain-containing protein n=1 Tax=Entomobacter blattae TaxID=2762277 RepID=A0A7H1NPW3_9PROT|nr:hypothetical protein [Entomobacter blattae]QNT77823.1 hypothetical protein JGUZn3_05780 [Entomobacter blattae]